MLMKMWDKRNSYSLLGWDVKMVQALLKIVWQLLTKLNLLLPYSSVIVLLSIYMNKLKMYIHTKAAQGFV